VIYRMKGRKKRANNTRSIILFYGFIGFIIIVLYMWGKVQIDFILRDIDTLRDKKSVLQIEVDNLQIEVNRMRSYTRIVKEARKLGLDFVAASKITTLEVDLQGIDSYDYNRPLKLRYAGLNPFNKPEEEASEDK